MDFVSELVRKRGKENLQKFIQFIVGIFHRYSFTFQMLWQSNVLIYCNLFVLLIFILFFFFLFWL